MRLIKTTIYSLLYALARATEPFRYGHEISILCYHSISDNPHETAISARAFEHHLQLFKERGYAFVSLDDVTSWQDGTHDLPHKAVALTFDDGYEDFKSVVLPLLKKYQAPATLFVIANPSATGWRMDEEPPFLTPADIDVLRTEPLVTIGFHSYSHPDLSRLSQEIAVKEVAAPFPARYFAYPGGNYSDEAIAAVKVAGYRAAFSIKPTLVHKNSDRYLMPRNVVLQDMQDWKVLLRASRAIDWYRGLSLLFK